MMSTSIVFFFFFFGKNLVAGVINITIVKDNGGIKSYDTQSAHTSCLIQFVEREHASHLTPKFSICSSVKNVDEGNERGNNN